jgi:hypothetical protein
MLLALFFGAGAFICVVTVLALAFPGSFLESVWRLKPEAQLHFLELGRATSITLMAVVGAACGLSAIGLARNKGGDGGWPLPFLVSISSAIR